MKALPSKLNLGCGRKRIEGHLNVDKVPSVEPDLIHDLNVVPYPLPDSGFEEVCAYDVVEHLADLPVFMREVWRLGKPNALVRITTPHFSCSNSFTDPTHLRHMGYFSFDYFTAGHQWSFYGSEGFSIRHRRLVFEPTPMNRVVSRLANRFPNTYESRWAWMFPAWFIYIELLVIKPGVSPQSST